MTILTLTEMFLVGMLILTNELDEIDVIGLTLNYLQGMEWEQLLHGAS